ncbi:unnamed protein product [Prorocentrum cordatum]|uniref:J domain-containing protein n=1 Tax=Prorocentrum cordatum TaxID=2364126 RepID=A0ABN9PXT4_9DINO|nr:unnamed protein product [Polarella glacialis]
MASPDEALEQLAQLRAEDVLAALPPEARVKKLPEVKERILKQLRAESGAAGGPTAPERAAAPAAAAAPAPAPPPTRQPAPSLRPPPPPLLPLQTETQGLARVGSAEACGDEPWFADGAALQSLRDATRMAHAEQKILVGDPAREIRRICPSFDHKLGAGAVLRLGGSHHGGYGEPDVKYAYRQLSRALHPDKNPGVAEAPDAFRRLSEAVEELNALLDETRKAVQRICLVLGSAVAPEALERPQAALIAEASRLLYGVLGLSGEGVPLDSQRGLRRRAVAAFTSSPVWSGCARDTLLSKWFEEDWLLDLFAQAAMRNAYDCMPKRVRAQFLSLLYRAAAVEAVKQDGCVRGGWPPVMAQFPEVSLWGDFMGRLLCRVGKPVQDDLDGGAPDPDDDLSTWAIKWRGFIASVLPSGKHGAAAATDAELRALAAELWGDVVQWMRSEHKDSAQHLELFSAEAGSSAQWAFIPAMDLLLTVGDGMLTVTAEGASTDAPTDHQRRSFASALREAHRGGRKRGLQILEGEAKEREVKKTKLSRGPTRVVMLTNMVGPGEVDEDLEGETAEECAKYGKLVKCTVREAPGAPDHEAVRIFLEFAKVQSASKAYSDLNGRFFGGRSVKARFYDEERYARGDFERRGPTRTLLLSNLVGREDVDEDLQWETAEAAARYGRVLRCTVQVVSDAAQEAEAVQAFVEFEATSDAARALAELGGRTVGGRGELRARYVEDGTTSVEVERAQPEPPRAAAEPGPEEAGAGGAAAATAAAASAAVAAAASPGAPPARESAAAAGGDDASLWEL